MAEAIITPTISLVNGVPTVTSLDVAEKFGKRHDDVLRAIKRILSDLPEDFRLRNFAESSYINEQGKEQPCYNLTRDAFTLVAMGFTGKTALTWKVLYIAAFNAMEAKLREQALQENRPAPLTPSVALSSVSFHGDTIYCVDYNGKAFAPVRPITDNLGLAWTPQRQKLTANKERWSVTMIAVPTADGEQNMLCLPVHRLPAFLASINAKRAKPELRERIALYQAECNDALWRFWLNWRAERAQTAQVSPLSRRSDPERKALTAIINTWVGMAPIHYASARAQVNAHFGVASVDELTVAQVQEALRFVQAKIDTLPPALPAGEKEETRLPMYRNGLFHPIHTDKKHVAGPREKALTDFWKKEYGPRIQELETRFQEMMDSLDGAAGDLYSHAVSTIGHEADSMFSVSCILEGIALAQNMARVNFKEAMSLARLHMRMATSMAVAMRM